MTLESDWQKAQQILDDIAAKHSEKLDDHMAEQVRELGDKYRIHYTYLTPATWISVIDYGVTITIRYLCHPRRRRNSTHTIWKAILTAFSQEPGIDFAYPTQRFYNNRLEGKPEAGGPGSNKGRNRSLIKDNR